MSHFLADLDQLYILSNLTYFLLGLFAGIGTRLVDFKVEFGRVFENDAMRIILADEISPDSCRIWDIDSNKKLDKDRFRKDMGGVVEAYQEVARRLGIMPEAGQREHTGPVLVSDKSSAQ